MDPKMDPEGAPGGAQGGPKNEQENKPKNEPKMDPKWTPRGPQMDPRTVQNSLLEGRAVGDEAPEAPWEATTGQNGFQNGPRWPQGAPWEPQ